MPYTNGIAKAIIHELEKKGYLVYDFVYTDATFKYKNIFQKIHNLYRKTIYKDTDFKNKLKKQARIDGFNKRLKKIPKVNYALFIRPDLIPLEFIENIRKKTDKLISYQWDGMNRFPEIFNYTSLFDRFLTFDYKDIDLNKGILPTTNFFIPIENKININKESFYFLGSYDKHRFQQLEALKKTLSLIDIAQNLFFLPNNQEDAIILKEKKYPVIEKIDYAKNLILSQECSVLIDLVTSAHAGLSFRIFEALAYDKKLITNNKTIKEYDFYHPNNIFIWDETNELEIIEFLKKEYIPINEETKNKYSFDNWIKYILDEGTYINIDLPKTVN